MALLNPIDLAEPIIDYSDVDPAVMGTYTFNGGKRSDKDIDGDGAKMSGWDPRSPKGTDTYNGGHKSDKD